jgi:hypothetical protein
VAPGAPTTLPWAVESLAGSSEQAAASVDSREAQRAAGFMGSTRSMETIKYRASQPPRAGGRPSARMVEPGDRLVAARKAPTRVDPPAQK